MFINSEFLRLTSLGKWIYSHRILLLGPNNTSSTPDAHYDLAVRVDEPQLSLYHFGTQWPRRTDDPDIEIMVKTPKPNYMAILGP